MELRSSDLFLFLWGFVVVFIIVLLFFIDNRFLWEVENQRGEQRGKNGEDKSAKRSKR